MKPPKASDPSSHVLSRESRMTLIAAVWYFLSNKRTDRPGKRNFKLPTIVSGGTPTLDVECKYSDNLKRDDFSVGSPSCCGFILQDFFYEL